jgi:hypothetical protein
MIKKAVLLLALLLVPVLATAQAERELLLTPDGTMFSVERATSHADVEAAAMSYLVLSIRRDGPPVREVIPVTLSAGSHMNPALAYDAESEMLFMFWERAQSLVSRELLLATRNREGKWSEAVAFGSGGNVYRTNLRIAVTRKVDVVPANDDPFVMAGVSVHAVWWEQNRIDQNEQAQYAIFSIYDGDIRYEQHSLASLLTTLEKRDPQPVPEGFDPEVLRHPAVFSAATSDSVDVIFGDMQTNGFHRIGIRPGKRYSDARVHIPLGRKETNFPSPAFGAASNSVRIGTINGDPDRIAFYTRAQDAVRYVTYKDDHWSAMQSIALDEQVSGEAAVDAIRRLLNDE